MNDTSQEIEEIQTKMLRNATTAKRFSQARSLSSTVIHLSRRAIRRRRPGFSEEEVNIEFVSLHYGKELAEKLKKFMKEKNET